MPCLITIAVVATYFPCFILKVSSYLRETSKNVILTYRL